MEIFHNAPVDDCKKSRSPNCVDTAAEETKSSAAPSKIFNGTQDEAVPEIAHESRSRMTTFVP
jgi:hypothetical protein